MEYKVKRPDLVAYNHLRAIPKVIKTCPVCGKEFISQRSSHRKYCSVECYRRTRLGRKNPNAISAMLRVTTGGNAFWNSNPEKVQKQREKMLGRKRPYASIAWMGENNPKWCGGVTPKNRIIRTSVAYRQWRQKVFARDNWSCVICGSKKHIEADHIFQFAYHPELRLEITNGRTLCHEHHLQTPTYKQRMSL